MIGEREPGVTRRLRGIYDRIGAPLFEVPFAVAELGKLVDNAWHAVKVAFANEVARISAAHGLEPSGLAKPFLADMKLNLSACYLQPGGPFGGSCLPKDLAGMRRLARAAGTATPLLAGVARSNRDHLSWLVDAIAAQVPPPGPLLQFGLSFKSGTDDLRDSPLLALAGRLVARGYELAIHDPDVDPTKLLGANLEVARAHEAAWRGRLVRDPSVAARTARLIVVGKTMPGVRETLPREVPVIELPGLSGLTHPTVVRRRARGLPRAAG